MQKLRFYIFLKNELLAIFIGILLLRGPMRMGKNSPHDFDGNLGQSSSQPIVPMIIGNNILLLPR